MAVLRYVSDHIEQVIGGLVVLFLLTSILLLIINIGKKDDGTSGAGKRSSDDLDIGAIEAAMKRVIAMQGFAANAAANAEASSSNSAPAPVAADADAAQLNEAIRERDTKVQELAREIDRLTSEVANQKGAAAPGDGAPNAKVAELQTKIDELQARLQEYEIIEDDIADLSLYKDENARLKAELDRLKSGVGFAAEPEVSPFAAPGAEAAADVTAEAPVATDEPSPAEALFAQAQAEAEAAMPESASTEDVAIMGATGTGGAALIDAALAPDEIEIPVGRSKAKADADADALFALAPTESDSPSIFGDELDTEKMLSEVASLSEGDDSDSVLDGSLDTDKLMAEMGGIDPDPTPAQADPAPAPVAAAPAAAPAAPAPIFNKEEEPVGEEDLLAEFKDSNDGGQG